MKSSYAILKESNLVLELPLGLITLKSMKAYKKIVTSNKDFCVSFDLLLDLRETNIYITMDELNEYITYLLLQKNIFGKRKTAMLVKTPNQLVYCNALKAMEENLPMQVGIFKSLDASLEWLNKTEMKDEIASQLQYMRKEPQFQWFDEMNVLTES